MATLRAFPTKARARWTSSPRTARIRALRNSLAALALRARIRAQTPTPAGGGAWASVDWQCDTTNLGLAIGNRVGCSTAPSSPNVPLLTANSLPPGTPTEPCVLRNGLTKSSVEAAPCALRWRTQPSADWSSPRAASSHRSPSCPMRPRVRVLREAGLGDDGIVEAASGIEALRRIGTDPSIGLVLSDVHMPGMNGIDFLRTLRERRTKSELPVLLLTSGDAQTLAASALEDGANGWLLKPFTADSVRAACEPWLARSDR